MIYANFEKHLQKLAQDIYSEPHSESHTIAAREVVEEFCKDLDFQNALELGCGTAPALDLLKEWGKATLGITLGEEVVDHLVWRKDVHFTTLEDSSFDLVIARHILEHSPMPLILLMEMRRISRKYALVVMPVPDKRMIEYPNHYSVFPKENWEWLFKLSGWKILKFREADYCTEQDYTYREYRYLLEGV